MTIMRPATRKTSARTQHSYLGHRCAAGVSIPVRAAGFAARDKPVQVPSLGAVG
jgi:hypothetical protein